MFIKRNHFSLLSSTLSVIRFYRRSRRLLSEHCDATIYQHTVNAQIMQDTFHILILSF